MSESRIKNTKRILSTSMINRLIDTTFSFVNRTIIIYLLGSEFTGLSGLFSSVLQVLSLAEFGFGTVIVYYLYEPIAKNDTESINRIMTWIRKIYHVVGSMIFFGGLVTLPFLTKLIHGSPPENINIYILFILLLFNSGISYYLFAYKQVLLIADQRKDIISNINSIVRVCVNVLQFLALLLFKNYYLYTIVLVIGTMASNLMVNRVVTKRYPNLNHPGKHGEKLSLPPAVKKEVVGLMISRLSNVSRNAFDNLIISSTIGLVATTIYGNYFIIYSTVYGATCMISGAMQASVGNSIAVKSDKDNYENMLDFSLLYSWIVGWCSVTMACLYQPFMKLWVGEELMLSEANMLLFVLYFYFINLNHIRNLYLFGNAFWWKLKWAYLIEAIGNLVLNIVLGKFFGITGVLIATILTIFFCNYLMCNHILFKNYFKNQNIWIFYKQQFYYFLVATVVTTATYILCCSINNIVIRCVICVILPNILFFILYLPCDRFKSSMTIVKRIVKCH